MAPNSLATADNNYRSAAFKLRSACTFLKRHLPPDDSNEPESATPTIKPRARAVSVACALCVAELQQMEVGAREGHVCTHQQDNPVDRASNAGSDDVQDRSGKRQRQPDVGVIRQDLTNVDEKFETFTNALSILSGLLGDDDQILYEEHLMNWTEHIGWLKDRAHDTIRVLKAAMRIGQTVVLRQG